MLTLTTLFRHAAAVRNTMPNRLTPSQQNGADEIFTRFYPNLAPRARQIFTDLYGCDEKWASREHHVMGLLMASAVCECPSDCHGQEPKP